jgi:hypothetical protein
MLLLNSLNLELKVHGIQVWRFPLEKLFIPSIYIRLIHRGQDKAVIFMRKLGKKVEDLLDPWKLIEILAPNSEGLLRKIKDLLRFCVLSGCKNLSLEQQLPIQFKDAQKERKKKKK